MTEQNIEKKHVLMNNFQLLIILITFVEALNFKQNYLI